MNGERQIEFKEAAKSAVEKSQSGVAAPPAVTSAATVEIPAAAAGCCMYLVNNEPCNESATFSRRTPGGGVFLMCNAHADQVETYMKRRGKTITMSRV